MQIIFKLYIRIVYGICDNVLSRKNIWICDFWIWVLVCIQICVMLTLHGLIPFGPFIRCLFKTCYDNLTLFSILKKAPRFTTAPQPAAAPIDPRSDHPIEECESDEIFT